MRDQDVVAKATAALETSVGMILDSDVSEEEKRQELVETFEQFESYLDGNAAGGKAKFEKIFRVGKVADDGDHDAGDRTTGGDGGGASNHALSHLADLAVESQKFSSRAEALNWLISHPNGHAFTRLHKAAEPAKEQPMTLENIFKNYGAVKICKHICDVGKTGYDEHTLVSALTRYAAAQHPELRPDVAFSKLFESEEFVRRAISVAKSMPFVADLTPMVVTGSDARDLSDESEAYAQLQELGRQKWPTLSEAQQFVNALGDPVNRVWAEKVHRRPLPPANGAYEFPR
jgi:hypothetical protein